MNTAVHEKATTLAQSLSAQAAESDFVRARYTGRALEHDHVVVPELTGHGLTEAKIIYPPLLVMDQITRAIENHPGLDLIVNAIIEPIARAEFAVLGIPFPSPEEVAENSRRHHREALDMQETLSINEAINAGDQSINIVTMLGDILTK